MNEWGVSKEILLRHSGRDDHAQLRQDITRPMAEAESVVGLKALFTLEPRTHLENPATAWYSADSW